MSPAESIPAVGIISVSATGHLHERFRAVLFETVGDQFRLERLVARTMSEPEATAVPTEYVRGTQQPWLNLYDRIDVPVRSEGTSCKACLAPSTARLVHIHPGSMTAMALPEPERLVPDIFDAMRNTTLWERYEDCELEAVSHLGPTGTRPADRRFVDNEKQVFFEPYQLLSHPGAANFVASRRDELLSLPRRSGDDHDTELMQRALKALPKPIDSVVMEWVEYTQFQDGVIEELLHGLHPYLGSSPALYVHKASANPQGGDIELHSKSEAPHQRVALLALGLRTGVTLQRMFLTVRSLWPEAEIGALVLHSHSSDTRIWDSIRNTFRDRTGISRLLALWLTYLPRRSPLAEERETLQALNPSELPSELSELWESRIVGVPTQLLWGRPNIRLRPTSYFGHAISDRIAVVAVGSAMHSARLRARKVATSGPHWAVFDLPRIFRSYFDGAIHASVLRWLRPNEAWWGQSSADCVSLLLEIEDRSPDDWKILFPELLLAGAQSKIPAEGVSHLIARALAVDTVPDWDDEIIPWVRLGRHLCEWALQQDDD
jgi:hypothetical protein